MKKALIITLCVIVALSIAWIAFSLIGRVKAAALIPDSAIVRVSVSNPVRLFDGIMAHEPINETAAAAVLNMLKEAPLMKNRLLRFAARGNMEIALLPYSAFGGGLGAGGGWTTFVAAWDMGLLAPLLRFLPAVSSLFNIPNLYYVLAGKNSRFEFRAGDMTFYIGPYRNLLFITANSAIYESRAAISDSGEPFSIIKPSSYDAAILLSDAFIGFVLAEQNPSIAAILNNIVFDSTVEAGVSIYPKKIEFRLAAPVSSGQPGLSRLLEQRSGAPVMAERIPAAAQYATILSAGTLQELYQAALVFSPDLDETLKSAEASSRLILGLTLSDLLFSWSGKEFAVFGVEGRPHPVYAIQIADERKRQQVFDKAFKSIALNEDARLNLDGRRIPRVEVPEFLQKLLQKWNLFLPSPYYIVHKDFLLASESAEALLSAVRAIQRNDVLPKTAVWKNIAGGKTTASAFSLYYSLDLSMPFFLRQNTALSGFLSLYRQGLARMSFNRGVVDISLSLIPGSGGGVTLANGYPLEVGARPSNRVYGAGSGENSWIFFTSGGSAMSLNVADNTMYELIGQGTTGFVPYDGWIIPAEGTNAWVVAVGGRVTLVDAQMEPAPGFPVLTGLRLSAPPAAYEGRLYLCDEEGNVHTVDENGELNTWETSFIAAVRSPPSFLTVTAKKSSVAYAAVYPKSFFGEIWLLDADGKAFPNWPAPITPLSDSSTGISYGSPLLFTHNNRALVAFVNQAGQLLLYDENAAPVPPFPINLNGVFYIQPVFDGKFLWLASADGSFFRVDLDGEALYQHIAGFSVMEEGHITIFDCDGDKVPEVFITGEGNALHAYTRNFRSLEGFPLPVWGRPFFVPAQGSKKAEIFGMGMDRRLYRWQFR